MRSMLVTNLRWGRNSVCFVLATVALGCSSSNGDSGEASETLGPPDLSHAFESQTLEVGYEDDTTCLSWTLGNEEELWVNRVDGYNDGGWHHSNWFFVDEDTYSGPDGAWPCDDRGFETVSTGISGGVFFAQSTQATHDAQQFPPGAAFRIPPRSRVVGQVHLLNTTPQVLTTGFRFEVRTIEKEEVTQRMNPISISNLLLNLPPRSRSRFDMTCEFEPSFMERGYEPSFDIFYVLPHYHELGTGMSLRLSGGSRDGELVFNTESSVGEPLGVSLEPPVSFDGATGLKLSCEYDNPRDEIVKYGIGDQEMCVFLAFTNSPLGMAGASLGRNEDLGMIDGVPTTETPCVPVVYEPE